MAPIRHRQVDGLAVRVSPDPAALAGDAADLAAEALRSAVAERGVANVMLATGNSQLEFVGQLTAMRGVPWSATVVFHMDEYVGVGADHPAGFRRWIRRRVADRTHPRRAHYLNGLAEPAEECRRYAALLAAHPLDLCCLGIGENGHLAFNDPPVADFDDPADVKVVILDTPCRRQQVHEGHFPDLASVPTRAVTVTIPALLRARRVLAIVPEARKAAPVQRTLLGPVTTACPATALRRIDRATLFLEPASAARLGPGWSPHP